MVSRRSRAFCKALAEETGHQVNRYASSDSVADRLGMEPDKAATLAAELGEAGLVRIGGGHSVMLEEALKLQKPQPDGALVITPYDEKKAA
jgi:hypothetical protein